jgi:hypothetical protein
MEASKLYDTSVVIKLISKDKVDRIPGYITIYTVIEYPPSLIYADKILYPTKEDYETAIKWQVNLRKTGNPLPAIDLVIAAIGFNNGYEVITMDKHFKYIQEIEKGLKLSIL